MSSSIAPNARNYAFCASVTPRIPAVLLRRPPGQLSQFPLASIEARHRQRLTEEGYRSLMRLRFSQGDRAGALRAYANGRAVLAEQLQVEPEPETVALASHRRPYLMARCWDAPPSLAS